LCGRKYNYRHVTIVYFDEESYAKRDFRNPLLIEEKTEELLS
jgi:hypothetical protein